MNIIRIYNKNQFIGKISCCRNATAILLPDFKLQPILSYNIFYISDNITKEKMHNAIMIYNKIKMRLNYALDVKNIYNKKIKNR